MVRASPVSWQSEPVERFDNRNDRDDDNRFADMQYDTLTHSCMDRESRDRKRADQVSVRRMLMQLRRAETFATRFEELSQELRRQVAEQLPVDADLRVRLHRLRERYERYTDGVLIEERHAVREQVEHAIRTGGTMMEGTIAIARNGQRKYWSSLDVSEGDV